MLKLKKLSLALCVLMVSSGGIAAPILVNSQKNIEEYKLDNGLRIVLAPNAKEDKVYMNVVYFTGALDDPQGKGGLAHLLEHLLFKGTQDVKDEEFQRRLDQHSLMSNAMTSFHYTQYINVMRAEQKNIDELLYLEAQRMDKSVIKMQHVPNEIEIVKREREIRLDQPFAVVQDQIFKELYGNQSLGRAPIGDLQELQSISLNDLQKFYKTWYKPNNAAIILTGNFDKQATLKQIEQQFSTIPAAANFPDRAINQIPPLDLEKLKNRRFNVKKGSDYATFVGYMGGADLAIQNRLSLADTIFTLEPSGRLYQQLVKNKQAIGVGGATNLENQYNFVLLGAGFTPQLHDAKQVEKVVIQQVEQGEKLTEAEVNRVKKLVQNSLDKVENDAISFGSMLANYVVTAPQGWSQYFQDLDELSHMKVSDINQTYQQFFTADKRLIIEIEPTPEDQKKAQQQALSTPSTLKSAQQEKPEPLKDASVYIIEQQQYLDETKQAVNQRIVPKVQTGKIKHLDYVFYPVALKDDKVYATLNVNLGTVKSLSGQQVTLSQMANMLTRGSKKYNLQQVQDKAIEVNGAVSSSYHTQSNRITIQISADKQYFYDYFKFVIEMLKNPAFDAEDYAVNKASDLAALERPYTEPETVSALTMSQLTDRHDVDDIRHYLLPHELKQKLQQSDLQQAKKIYRDFFAMNHADIVISGEFDVKQVEQLLGKTLAKWKTKQPYERVLTPYQTFKGQKVHALAEQREFGSYLAYLTFPVGQNHADAAAMSVLSYILGGSQLSSRLAYELREQNNLTYGFGHSIHLSQFQNSGYWSLSVNYQPSLADQVSRAVHKTIQDLKDKGVSEQELEAAKAELLKRRASILADDKRVHGLLVTQKDSGKTMLDTLVRDKQIQQVTKADVERVLHQYFDLNHMIEVMADQYGQSLEMK